MVKWLGPTLCDQTVSGPNGSITIQNNSGLNTALDLRSDGLTLFINDINYLVYRVFAMIIHLYLHFNHMNSLLMVL